MEGTPLYPLFIRGEIGLFLLKKMGINFSPLFIKGEIFLDPPLHKWDKNYFPLFVRGGEGVFSPLYFVQMEGTPLYPLFIRGEIGLLFPS